MSYQYGEVSFTALAEFISKLNQSMVHHVGYCGETQEEIYDTLTNDFSTKDFTVIYKEDQLIGALGFDLDEEGKRVELWGPFVFHREWQEVATKLWEAQMRAVVQKKPLIFYGFYNQSNIKAKEFIKRLGGRMTGEHLLLKKVHSLSPTRATIVQELQEDDFVAFSNLHDSIFKDTYYDGNEIVTRLDDQNKVYTIKEDGQTVGYVYVEGNKEFNEGTIEYIGVANEHRKKGYGKLLLDKALTFLFLELEIEEVTISVGKENVAAINLYLSLGFYVDHTMEAYVLHQ